MSFANEQDGVSTFDDLFNEYFNPLCAYCQYKFGFDIDTAKDAVHSGFIHLLESDFTFSSKISSRAYVYRVVTNICLDLLRHEKIKKGYLQAAQKQLTEMDTGDDNKLAELKELQNDINKAVAELPEYMRKVFELSRNEGQKYAEIARKLDISVKTVETQMSRALAKLRQKLASYLSVYWILLLVQLFSKK